MKLREPRGGKPRDARLDHSWRRDGNFSTYPSSRVSQVPRQLFVADAPVEQVDAVAAQIGGHALGVTDTGQRAMMTMWSSQDTPPAMRAV